ncbi:MAG: SDR family oxidoreductase [Planctomycetota bacterium]
MIADPNTHPVSVVTGASSGIGLATAKRLADAGHHVVLVGRTESTLHDAADSLNARAGTTAIAANIGDPDQARAIVTHVVEELGRIDAVINNAGAAPLVPIEDTTDELLDHTFRVNALGPAALISEAWPTLKTQRSGRIVNVSTMGTQDPFPGFFAYAASKAALNLMTQSCASEGAEFGIRAFTVAPGAVETPMLRGLFDESVIPKDICFAPDDVAEIIAECALGNRDEDSGTVIWMPNPTNTDA